MEQQLIGVGHGFVYAMVVMVFIFLAKKFADWRTRDMDDDHEVEENSNAAVGLRRAGLYLGLAIGMTGALAGDSQGLIKDLTTLAWEGAVILVLLFVSRALCDIVLLAGIDNDAEAKNGNPAVGFMELGVYVASGLVLCGAFSGEGGGLVSALAFFALGQIVLMVLFYCYEMITPFDIREEIKAANPAAGLSAAGIIVALGIILRASLSGPAQGWAQDLAGFGLSAGVGIVMLLIFRKLTDILLLPGTDIATEVSRDRNMAAIALTEGAILAIAFIIAAVV